MKIDDAKWRAAVAFLNVPGLAPAPEPTELLILAMLKKFAEMGFGVQYRIVGKKGDRWRLQVGLESDDLSVEMETLEGCAVELAARIG